MKKANDLIDLFSQDTFLESVSKITGKTKDFIQTKIIDKYQNDPYFAYDISNVKFSNLEEMYYNFLDLIVKHVNS
ncbi:MAG: hypothetical protein QXF12_02230 [Candidatus Aenigmatarchaeota archaeon]